MNQPKQTKKLLERENFNLSRSSFFLEKEIWPQIEDMMDSTASQMITLKL